MVLTMVYNTQIEWLRLALSKGPVFSPHLRLRTETDPVSETSCSLEYQTMEKVQKPSKSVNIRYYLSVQVFVPVKCRII
jgi:hypothetical protein